MLLSCSYLSLLPFSFPFDGAGVTQRFGYLSLAVVTVVTYRFTNLGINGCMLRHVHAP